MSESGSPPDTGTAPHAGSATGAGPDLEAADIAHLEAIARRIRVEIVLMGAEINLVTANIPAGTVFDALVMSLTQAIPPIDLTSVGMPGCVGHPVGGVNWLYVAPAATAQTTWAVPNSPAYIGVPVINQSFMYSPPRTPLGIIASNGVLLVLGQM